MSKYIIFILLLNMNCYAYEVNIYQASTPKTSLLEVIDDCGQSHKLLIDNKKLNSFNTLTWLNLLFDTKTYCQKNSDQKLDR